jgi:hypothetical protein
MAARRRNPGTLMVWRLTGGAFLVCKKSWRVFIVEGIAINVRRCPVSLIN